MMSFSRVLKSTASFQRVGQQVTKRPLSFLHLQPTPSNFISEQFGKSHYYFKTYIASKKIQVHDAESNSPVDLTKVYSLPDKHLLELVQSLLRQFQPFAMLHVLTELNGNFEFSNEFSSRILRKFAFADEENLSLFRKLLSARKRNTFQFVIEDINLVISTCLEREQLTEAVNWYIFSQDILKLKPDQDTFSKLLVAFSKEKKWDELIFLLGEMKFQDIPLSKHSAESILLGSALHPSSRWRHAVRVIDDLLERSKTDSSIGVADGNIDSKTMGLIKQSHIVDRNVLGSAFLTAMQAKQPTAVRDLYNRIVSAHHKIETTEGDELRLHSVLPVHCDEAVVPLGLSAISLGDHAFICDLLRRNLSEAESSSSSTASLFSDEHIAKQSLEGEEAVSVYGALLVNDVVELLKHRPAANCGKQFGVVMMWCVHHNKTALVVLLWNVLIQELIASLQSTHVQKNDIVVNALSDVLSACCNSIVPATTDLVQYQHNKKIANFLNAALFNMNSNTSNKTAPAFMSLTAADVSTHTDHPATINSLLDTVLSVDMKVDSSVANRMLGAFTHLQDNKAAFELLSRCLRHDIAVDEKVMDDLFDLLVADGDHKLVLDLCEFSIKQMDDAYRAKRVATIAARGTAYLPKIKSQMQEDNSLSTGVASVVEPKDRGFSPYVFTVAMKSLLALGDVDSIVRLLDNEIPTKGFAASTHNYELAVRALFSHGRYEEAVRLFQQGVADKSAHVQTHKALLRLRPDQAAKLKRDAWRDPTKAPVQRINFSNYSIAADSLHNNEDLLLCTLQCAARVRLAEEALTIFSERESLTVRGLARMQLHKRCDLVNQVIVSLSSETHIAILADFLRSTSTLTDGFVPPMHTLQLAIAAAVAVQDSAAVGAVLEYATQFSFSVGSDLSRERLMELVQSEVRVEASQLGAILQFVETCEHLKDAI